MSLFRVGGGVQYTDSDGVVGISSGATLVSGVSGSVVLWLLEGKDGIVPQLRDGVYESVAASTSPPISLPPMLSLAALEISIDSVLALELILFSVSLQSQEVLLLAFFQLERCRLGSWSVEIACGSPTIYEKKEAERFSSASREVVYR